MRVMGQWGRNKSFSVVSCKYCKYGKYGGGLAGVVRSQMDVLQILYLIQSSFRDVRGEQKGKTCVLGVGGWWSMLTA